MNQADVRIANAVPMTLTPAMRRAIVLMMLVAAGWLRIAALDQYPAPIHQDELTDIYDGYSIATTGADRTGARWPTLVRSMGPGGYCPTLNVYLCAAVARVTGFSVWTGRLPAVIGGLLTVWLVYLLARRLLGDCGGILALAFVAFSPIHILYSRQVHSGVYLPPLFAVLVLYLLYHWLDRTEHEHARPALGLLALIGIVVGFSTQAYTGMRITALFLAALVLAVTFCRLGPQRGQWRLSFGCSFVLTIAVLLGATVTIYSAITMPDIFFSRAGHIIPPLSNGPRWWLGTIATNLANNLDPRYLFLSFGDYRHLSVERLGVASLPFLYVGIVGLAVCSVRQRDIRPALIPIAVLIGLVPGVISTGNPNPMRTSVVWSIYPIAAAYGATLFIDVARALRQRIDRARPIASRGAVGSMVHRVGLVGTAAIVGVCGAYYTVRYVERSDLHALASQRDYVEVGTWLHAHGKEYDRVYIDVDGVFGYLYVAAFSGMSPAEFQQTPREGDVTSMGWDNVHRLGRYYFASSEQARLAWQTSPGDERWLVIRNPKDLTELSAGARVSAAAHRP